MSPRVGREDRTVSQRTFIAVAVVVAIMLIAGTAAAVGVVEYDEVPLTQAEIDDNWIVDRAVPSGGFESVSFDGRADVLEMRVDPDNRSDGSAFFYTEGLQRQTPGASALRAELYVDPAWEGEEVRAGLWGVGHLESGVRSAFPIIEYHQVDGSIGWRVWDSDPGVWIPHPATGSYGDWSSLEIVLDSENDEFIMTVDGVSMKIPALGSVTLGEVIVNMFNFGPTTAAYSMHVSNFAIGNVLPSPADKDDCRKGGYAAFGYANQGLCIAGIVSNR